MPLDNIFIFLDASREDMHASTRSHDPFTPFPFLCFPLLRISFYLSLKTSLQKADHSTAVPADRKFMLRSPDPGQVF